MTFPSLSPVHHLHPPSYVSVDIGKVQEDGTVRKLDVKAGDRILFGKYSGTEVKLDGEEHLILREDDILGVIEK